MKKLIVISVFVLMASSIVYGYTYSDYTWTTNPANGHLYAITLDYSNWSQAEAWAVEVGGHLVTINDSTENAWVANFAKDSYCQGYPTWNHANLAWIGLEYVSGDMSLKESWKWINGDPVDYWNPYDGLSPNNGVHMYIHGANHDTGPGEWNNDIDHDILDNMYSRGVIEIPEPATLLVLGLGGLFLRKRKA